MVAARFGFMEGTSFEEDQAALFAVAPMLRRVLARLHQFGSDQLGPVFAELDAVKSLSGRGSGRDAGPGADPRVRARLGCGVDDRMGPVLGPSYRAGGAAALVKVAEAVAKPTTPRWPRRSCPRGSRSATPRWR